MAREEAILNLNYLKDFKTPDQVEALDMAIKALEQEPCEDAVSRQWLMRKATERFYITNYFNNITKMIEEAPSVNPQESKWISVNERLPESCGMYIVTRKIYDCPDTAPIIMSDESWFDGQNTWHNDNRINHKRGYLSDVIAWMPLPKPYKVESEDS